MSRPLTLLPLAAEAGPRVCLRSAIAFSAVATWCVVLSEHRGISGFAASRATLTRACSAASPASGRGESKVAASPVESGVSLADSPVGGVSLHPLSHGRRIALLPLPLTGEGRGEGGIPAAQLQARAKCLWRGTCAGHEPTTSTVKLSGTIAGRGCGCSDVAAGVAPNSAAGRNSRCVFASSAIVRALFCVATVSTTR